jgi:alpha-1,3-mannosyltransferase
MVNNHLVSFSFDCFAIFFLWLSIFSFQRGSWTAGTVAFTLALSISSHLLLALPALGIVMVLALGPVKAAKHVFAVLLYLVLMTAPFAQTPSEMKTHVAWLLNSTPWFSYENSTWKIFPQEFYYSGLFATMLRLALASSFTTFALCSWLRPLRQPFPRAVAATTHATSPLSSEKREAIASRVDADYIASTLIGAVFLQFMFAPSLSNSAFVYISWGAPVLWHFFPYVDSNLIMGLILGLDRGWTWFISGTTYAAVGMQCIFVFSLGTSFLKAASTDRQKKDKARQLELPRTTKGEKRTGPA